MSKTLFGTDGVRGIAGKYPLEKTLVRRLGAAAAVVYKRHHDHRKPFFLVGRDTRGSGPWIAEAFAQGAATQNLPLRDLGIISTPALAHLVPKRRALGGVMISASHNPAAFNGIKLFGPDGRKCPDAWEHEIEQELEKTALIAAGKALRFARDQKGLADYLAFLKSTLPKRFSLKGMTLVLDCSHGSMSRIAPAFLRALGAKVIALGAAPTGRNINAHCGSQHTQKLQQTVKRVKAHAGIAFDGDADRAIFCDENGEALDGDFVLACAARLLKDEKRLRKNTVVVTVMANLGLMKQLEAWGIKTVSTPVGDRYVAEALDAHGAMLGGEQSGHIIFHDYLPTGDGLLTALQMLALLQKAKQPFSWVTNLFQRYPQVLKNIDVHTKTPIDQCLRLSQAIRDAEGELGDQGRVVVRYSGTEPLLRIMMEGPEKKRLEVLAEQIASEALAALGNGK